MVLFSGGGVACASVTAVALRLWKRGVEGQRGSGIDRDQALHDLRPTPAAAVAGLDEGGAERRLLEAVERRGEITPARAALETPLTVAEADRMLSELTRGGHLEVSLDGGKLLYGLSAGEGILSPSAELPRTLYARSSRNRPTRQSVE